MRKTKKGVKLNRKEASELQEAIRRVSLQYDIVETPESLNYHCAILGTRAEMRSLIESGLIRGTETRRGIMGWWRLTERGQNIIKYWLNSGYKLTWGERHEWPQVVNENGENVENLIIPKNIWFAENYIKINPSVHSSTWGETNE